MGNSNPSVVYLNVKVNKSKLAGCITDNIFQDQDTIVHSHKVPELIEYYTFTLTVPNTLSIIRNIDNVTVFKCHKKCILMIQRFTDKDIEINVMETRQCQSFSNTSLYFGNMSEVEYCLAFDNSRVFSRSGTEITAYNEATVESHNNCTISANDNSVIRADSESNILAFGQSTVYSSHSTVKAFDESTIYANNRTHVHAEDNSKVIARHNSIILGAYDYAEITLCDFTTLLSHSEKVKIKKENHFGLIASPYFEVKEDTLVYKKLSKGLICTLKLEKGQTFQSVEYSKCRTDRAFVVSIEDLDTGKQYNSGPSYYDITFNYKVGKTVSTNYDSNLKECAPGIHFFLSREDAVNYDF